MPKKLFSFFSKQPEGSSGQSITPQVLSVLAQLPTAVLLLDPEGNIGLANAAAERLLGYASGMLTGQNVQKLGVSASQLQAGKTGKETDTPPLALTGANGRTVTLRAGITPLDQTGCRIVSLEEAAPAQTAHDTAFLQAILDSYPGPVTVQDMNGRCVFWNAQAAKLFGHTPAQAQGKIIYQLLPKKFAASLHWLDEEFCSGKPRTEPARLDFQTPDGRQLRLSLEKAFLPSGDKSPRFMVTLYEDITASHEREQKLERSQKLLQAILENIPLGLYTRDCDAKITFFNKQSMQVLGETSAYRTDHPHAYQGEEVVEYEQREKQILKEGKTYEYPEEVYMDSSGKKKIVHMIKVPLMDAGPKPLVLTIVEDVTKRREQEQEIQRVNGFLSAIVQNAPIALYARAEDGRMLLRNKQCTTLFGAVEEADFDERGGLRHETPEQVTNYINREHAILQDGKTLDIPEEEYITPKGEKKLLHLVKTPVQEGRCVITLVEDITSKKEQECALIESKNFLQAVVDQLPVSLSVKNYEGQYILWNKKSEELFGVQAKDVIGRSAYRTDLNKEQAEFVRATDLRVFESKREQNIPQELISSATEGIKIMHTVKTPVFNPDGTPNCLLVVSEDITAKTKMEKQIREASDKNTLLVENAREGVVMVEDGKIMYANRAFITMLGYTKLDELKGKMLLDLSTEDHRVFLKDKYEAVRSGADNSSAAIDAHFTRQDGTKLEAKFAAMLAKYLGRRIVLGFASDVTAANRSLRELKNERNNFRQAFENSTSPEFILSSPRGYISVMNEACRKLFGFTKADKKFYCNVYLRPALTLSVRRLMKEGLPARMNYTFDFDRAARQFPGRISGSGKLALDVSLRPLSKRDAKDGSVEAEYLVTLTVQEEVPTPPSAGPSGPLPLTTPTQPDDQAAPSSAPEPVLKLARTAPGAVSLPPLPPFLTKRGRAQERVVLPNSEPYALCDEDFTITACNGPLCSLCELQEDELKGQDIRHLFAADEKPLVDQDFLLLKKEGKLSNREYTLMLGSGLETCSVRVNAVKEQDGHFLFVLRSLAFHQQIMKILEERSALLSALRSATDGGVLRIDFTHGRLGHIEQLNNWLSKKTGFLHAELAQRPFAGLFAELDDGVSTVEAEIARAQEQLLKHGAAVLYLPLYTKEGPGVQAQVTLTVLDIPSQQAVLAVVRDLSASIKQSKEARELTSLLQTLPGIYLRVDGAGKVLEVSSNLSYLDDPLARRLFLNHTPDVFWPEEAAARALFTLKEALAVRASSGFDFEWMCQGQARFYEAAVSPLPLENEAIIWVRDASDKRVYDRHLHALYMLAKSSGLSMTEQVEKILALGRQIFEADLGVVLLFEPHHNRLESTVLYTTPNALNVERHMSFAVEECLQDVADGATVLLPDAGGLSCTRCLHHERQFQALAAAPLVVDGKVNGALCFMSQTPRGRFVPGAEELLGLLARLLSLHIELRQADKMLGDAARMFSRTLDDLQAPALKLDPDFLVTYVNDPMLRWMNRSKDQLLGRELFAELIRHEDISKRMLQDAVRNASGKTSCQVKWDVRMPSGLYQEIPWDVFVCKDTQGRVEWYALMAQAAN